MYHDAQYNFEGIDGLLYADITGEVILNIYDDFQAKFAQRNLIPQQDAFQGGNPYDFYVIGVQVFPFIKVRLLSDSIPFITTPELRYKIGSYSYVSGYEVEVDSEGNISSTPYFGQPSYLQYTHQSIAPGYFVCLPGVPASQALVVGDEFLTDDKIATNIYANAGGSFLAKSPHYCGAIAINLNDDFIADIRVLYYYFVSIPPNLANLGRYIFAY